MIDIPERVNFLKRVHLFHELKDDQLAEIAAQLHESSPTAGVRIFAEEDHADSFYLVYKGRAVAFKTIKGKKTELAFFTRSDYFGEEGLLERRHRSASVEATEETLLFELHRADFYKLIKKFPKLKPNFQVSISSRRLARQLQFPWVNKGEVIYFIARKHPILLAQSLLAPGFSMLAPIFFLFWGMAANSSAAIIASVIAFVGIAGWITWNVIDWGNDYYIVTNQRVIWLEKVIGLYDSRQEAPLSTVLSVAVETDMTGRIMDYGSVVVRTFVGQLIFSYVNHPYQAERMINEQWERTKVVAGKVERDATVNAVRKKLGLTDRTAAAAPPPPPPPAIPHTQKKDLLRIALQNMFRLRMEDSGVITYRKHWYVLFLQVWKPTFFILMTFILMVSRTVKLFQDPNIAFVKWTNWRPTFDTILLSLPLLLLPLCVWWAWEYVDWKNDIFQVTPDQIIDIDRKPFGTEERRAAPIENILGTEYKRIGVAAYFLNFGTVFITVGGTQLTFDDVMDPAAVQADIDKRRTARLAKKREAEVSTERERMATWLAIYHQNAQEFHDDKPPQGK